MPSNASSGDVNNNNTTTTTITSRTDPNTTHPSTSIDMSTEQSPQTVVVVTAETPTDGAQSSTAQSTVPVTTPTNRTSTGCRSSSPRTSHNPPLASSSTQSDYLYFDANTFKQVKRLYCGMLMVAMAYSITMIVMMVVLYKTLPNTIHSFESSLSSMRSNIGPNQQIMSYRNFETVGPPGEAGQMLGGAFTVHDKNFKFRGRIGHEPARSYLDQVIAINFLTSILYLLAFYAAHRELYTLTLAFTSTLAFTMMFSVVKIFVEGVHFPNNFMSLLLRVSIVFVALVYLGQLRRKQQFIRHANSFWLSPSSILSHPALHSSRMSPTQTAQLIRDFLASSSANAHKTDDELLREYQDQPPNYEEALRCPVPSGERTNNIAATRPTTSLSLASMVPASCRASQMSLGPPPSFEELTPNLVSVAAQSNSSTAEISVPIEQSHSSSSTKRSTSEQNLHHSN